MKISIFGAGYVGLVTGAVFAKHHKVVLIDRDQAKIDALKNGGRLPIYEPGLEELFETENISFSTESKAALNSDFIFICVGTPQAQDGSADLSAVKTVSLAIADVVAISNSQPIVVVKSTVPPGTCMLVDDAINKPNRQAAVLSNPEFLREGNAVHDALHPDRIVIGSAGDDIEASKLEELYIDTVESETEVIHTSRRSAELGKYANNAMLAARVSFANGMAALCDAIGADVTEVMRIVGADWRIGQFFLDAGCGWGGSCWPKDLEALQHVARSKDVVFPLLSTIVMQNDVAILQVRRKLVKHFGNLDGKKIAVLGIAFKPGTDDTRNSPTLKIVASLHTYGAHVRTYDSVAELPSIADPSRIADCWYVEQAIADVDAIVIATAWAEFNFAPGEVAELLKAAPKLSAIVDGRNLLGKDTIAELQRHGVTYYGIGRGTM